MSDDWKAAWLPLMARLGEELGSGEISWGADAVEAGAIRRYLEPLEFDCALHYDAEVARAHGHGDITAPYTGTAPFTAPPLWRHGQTLFDSAERNAQPMARGLRPPVPAEAPPFTGYFATDMEMDFLRPVVVGERLGRRGQRLVACEPKETKVGRGAFLTFESDTVSSEGDVVARMRFGLFCYNPHPPAEEAPT